jgi:hypothetical protein
MSARYSRLAVVSELLANSTCRWSTAAGQPSVSTHHWPACAQATRSSPPVESREKSSCPNVASVKCVEEVSSESARIRVSSVIPARLGCPAREESRIPGPFRTAAMHDHATAPALRLDASNLKHRTLAGSVRNPRTLCIFCAFSAFSVDNLWIVPPGKSPALHSKSAPAHYRSDAPRRSQKRPRQDAASAGLLCPHLDRRAVSLAWYSASRRRMCAMKMLLNVVLCSRRRSENPRRCSPFSSAPSFSAANIARSPAAFPGISAHFSPITTSLRPSRRVRRRGPNLANIRRYRGGRPGTVGISMNL